MLEACNLRYQLIPYIYTAARQAYDTGVSICRPLYYEWPEENEAYRQEGEYMFGDDILVSPIVTAAEQNGKTYHKTWLPEGQWFDVCRNKLIAGNQTIAEWYGQEEIPYFYKAGAIIPCNPEVKNLKSRPSELVVLVAPGDNGSTDLYEDQGDSQDYQNGAYTTTTISQQRAAGRINLVIRPRTGQFEGMLTERSYTVKFLAEGQPQSVGVDGADGVEWSWDENQKMVIVNIPKTACSEQITIRIVRGTEGIYDLPITDLRFDRSYDVSGRKIENRKSHHGIVIMNGKKVIK